MKQRATKGQVMITMLYIMVIGMLVTTGATYALISNTQSSTTYELGSRAMSAAESGLENAVLRLIRDPAYTGEVLTIDTQSTATISVSTASGTIITSQGDTNGVIRHMQAEIGYTGSVLTITSWKELPED
jgi:Tfp pilus assembly protein PilX